MAFSYISRLFQQLSKSRWIQIYFALVIIQTFLSISILVKTLINTEVVNQIENNSAVEDEPLLQEEGTIFGDFLTSKGYKIIYENVLFIIYETWRLWILTDGIVHLNSLTILASAWFSVFSRIFNVMLVVESRKWASYSFDSLKLENMHLQIALTVISFVLSVPVILTAYKSAKIIGWQIYKKIGSSISLQNMYHAVQKFELVLKIDIFFQVFLLIGVAIVTEKTSFRVVCIIMTFLMASSLVFSRIAITRESHWMMGIFLFLQLMLFACDVYSMVGLFQYPSTDLWYIGIVYALASITSIAFTVYLGILCEISFGKGLKEFVQWSPFQSRKSNKGEPQHATEIRLLNTKSNERLPIDDEDDDDYHVEHKSETMETATLTMTKDGGKFYYSKANIERISMERVDATPAYQIKMDRYMGDNTLNTIERLENPAVPKLAVQPISRASSANSEAHTVVASDSTMDDYSDRSKIMMLKSIGGNNY